MWWHHVGPLSWTYGARCMVCNNLIISLVNMSVRITWYASVWHTPVNSCLKLECNHGILTPHLSVRCQIDFACIVPRSVRVLALTATATKSDRLDVSCTLGQRNPYVLARCPAKANVIYHAGSFQGIEETFQPFAKQLVLKRNQFPKTIIYGQTFGICADIYLYLKKCLSVAFTYPQDAPDLPDFRLVEMFTIVTECKHKSKILDKQ